MIEPDAKPRPSRRGLFISIAAALTVGVVGIAFVMSSREKPRLADVTPAVQVKPPEPLHKPEPPAGDYIGSESCTECHAEISRAYASHPMGQSLASIENAISIEDYSDQATVKPAGRRSYRVEKTDEGVTHHEAMKTSDGETLYDQAVEVDYALGSGRRGRAYLIDREGLLFLSPLNWYAGRQKWDLAPGYHPENHPRFERRAIDACIVCHSGRTTSDRDVPDRFDDPVFLEEAIGCERCHGPAGDHVAYHRNEGARSGSDPIVNPAHLDVSRREAVCNQCHLQGEERILRYGRTEHDFRPGDLLDDIWVTFVSGQRAGTSESARAVSHVEQMRASRCYEATDGRLGCISCHDPHSVPKPEQREEFYDSKCLNCHDNQSCSLPEPQRNEHPAGGSCTQCHMPPLETSDVPHTSLADHRILRNPGAETTAAASRASQQLEVFDGAAERLPSVEVERARGLMLIRLAEQQSSAAQAYEAERVLKPILAAADDDIPVLDALGTASRLQQRPTEAIRYWQRVLELDPDHESALIALAKTYHETGQFAEGIKTLDQLFEFNRWISELHGRRAHMLGQLGRFDEGIAAAQQALQLNPTLSQIYGWLAEIYQLRGLPDESEQYRELYQKLEQ